MATVSIGAFRRSLDASEPPSGLSRPFAALWWAGKDDWNRAHAIVQDADGGDAAWVHAYLHRKEGDLGNAAYWYRRAGRPVVTDEPVDEWTMISETLLGG